MSKKLHIVFDGNDLCVTQDTAGTNNVERYPKSAIKGVTPIGLITKPSNGDMAYENASGAFEIGETITGGTSGATAVVVGFRGTSGLVLQQIDGVFEDGEEITGGTSSETADIVSTELTSYDGEWTYPRNTVTILTVDMLDGASLMIELQDVSNKNTWNTGDQAGINAASADFNTWLKA